MKLLNIATEERNIFFLQKYQNKYKFIIYNAHFDFDYSKIAINDKLVREAEIRNGISSSYFI